MPGGVPQIERLQSWRARPERDLAVAATIRAMAQTAARTHRRLGELIELWQEILPPELSDHTSVQTLRGSVLHVAVDSAPVMYEIDHRLRSGATEELRRRFRGTLSRVRLRLETVQ